MIPTLLYLPVTLSSIFFLAQFLAEFSVDCGGCSAESFFVQLHQNLKNSDFSDLVVSTTPDKTEGGDPQWEVYPSMATDLDVEFTFDVDSSDNHTPDGLCWFGADPITDFTRILAGTYTWSAGDTTSTSIDPDVIDDFVTEKYKEYVRRSQSFTFCSRFSCTFSTVNASCLCSDVTNIFFP